jgi:hypothetical protein
METKIMALVPCSLGILLGANANEEENLASALCAQEIVLGTNEYGEEDHGASILILWDLEDLEHCYQKILPVV